MAVDSAGILDKAAPIEYTTQQAIDDLLLSYAQGEVEGDVLVRTLKDLELPHGYSDVIVRAIRLMVDHKISSLQYAEMDSILTRGFWPLWQHCERVYIEPDQWGKPRKRFCKWCGKSQTGKCPKCGGWLDDLVALSETWLAEERERAENEAV